MEAKGNTCSFQININKHELLYNGSSYIKLPKQIDQKSLLLVLKTTTILALLLTVRRLIQITDLY